MRDLFFGSVFPSEYGSLKPQHDMKKAVEEEFVSDATVQKIVKKILNSADLTTPSPEGSPRTHLEVENLVAPAEVALNSWCGEVFVRIATMAKQCFSS